MLQGKIQSVWLGARSRMVGREGLEVPPVEKVSGRQ